MLKKFFKNSIVFGFADQISKIAGVFALPIITPHLTNDDYGVMGVLMAYVGLLSILRSLGLNILIFNSYYHSPTRYKWVWRQVLGFLNIWFVVFAILLGLLLYLVFPEDYTGFRFVAILLIVLPSLVLGPYTVLGIMKYQLAQNPNPIAVRSFIFGIVTVTLNIYTIAYLKLGFMGWLYTTAIVGVLSNISYFLLFVKDEEMKPIYSFRYRHWKKKLAVALPIIPHSYSSFLLNSSDQVVMERLDLSTASIGDYSFPAKFGSYFSSFSNAVNKAITPMLMEMYKQDRDEKARYLVYIFQLVLFALTFTSAIWIKEVFQLLVKNEELARTYYLAIPIIIGYNYRAMYVGSNQKYFYTERTKILWKVTFTAGVSNVLLNLVFIPIYGIAAAAYTTFFTLLYMGYAGFYLKDYKEIGGVNFRPLLWLILTIVILVMAIYSVDLNLMYKFIITFLFNSTVLYFLGCFRRKLKA